MDQVRAVKKSKCFGSDLEHIKYTQWSYVPPHCDFWALYGIRLHAD